MATDKMNEIYEFVLKEMEANDIEDTPVNRFWFLVAMRDGIKQAAEEDPKPLSLSESVDKTFYLIGLDMEIGHLSRHVTTIDLDEE